MSFDDPVEYIVKIKKDKSLSFKDVVVQKLRLEGFDVRETALRCPGCVNVTVVAQDGTTDISIAEVGDYAQWKMYRKELYRWVYDYAGDYGGVLYAKIHEDLAKFAELKYTPPPYTNSWDR